MEWLDSIAGPGYTAAILWTFAALIFLVVVLIIIKLIRSMTFGTFVAGGRNRKTRLAVMDATAIDSNRRLVLVRRDDVEHLILIGGQTDIVVERDIRLSQQKRPSLAGESRLESQQARPRPVDQPPAAPPRQMREAPPAPARRPAPPPAPSPAAVVPTPPQQRIAPQPPSPAQPNAAPPRETPAIPLSPPAESREDIDDDLIRELEVSPDDKPAGSERRAVSLDDEMTKLLDELSTHKK